MTRFARAKGSKASNERVPEKATPWSVMKEEMERKKQEDADNKEREKVNKVRDENYKKFLQEQASDTKNEWAEFPESVASKPPKKTIEKSEKKKCKDKLSLKDMIELLKPHDKIDAKVDKLTAKIDEVLTKLENKMEVTDNCENENTMNNIAEKKRKKKKISKHENNDSPMEVSSKVEPPKLVIKKTKNIKISLKINALPKEKKQDPSKIGKQDSVEGTIMTESQKRKKKIAKQNGNMKDKAEHEADNEINENKFKDSVEKSPKMNNKNKKRKNLNESVENSPNKKGKFEKQIKPQYQKKHEMKAVKVHDNVAENQDNVEQKKITKSMKRRLREKKRILIPTNQIENMKDKTKHEADNEINQNKLKDSVEESPKINNKNKKRKNLDEGEENSPNKKGKFEKQFKPEYQKNHKTKVAAENQDNVEHRKMTKSLKRKLKEKNKIMQAQNKQNENSQEKIEHQADNEINKFKDNQHKSPKMDRQNKKWKNLDEREENMLDKSENFVQHDKLQYQKKHKMKVAKVRDNLEHKRRKPDNTVTKLLINGKEVEIVRYDGFPVKKEEADRLTTLRKQMIAKGLPRSEVQRTMLLERRRAEKALAREKKQVCFKCRKAGHLLAECPELNSEFQAVAVAGTGICFKCGSTEHTHFQCKVTKDDQFKFATCYICQTQGHIAKQCPDNPRGLYPQGGACKVCGDVTHLKKDCPQTVQEKEDNAIFLEKISNGNIEGIDEVKKKAKPIPTKTKVVKF